MITVTMPKEEYDLLVSKANANNEILTLTKKQIAKFVEEKLLNLSYRLRNVTFHNADSVADYIQENAHTVGLEEAERFNPISTN